MPVEHIKFGCQFKCHHKLLSSKKKIETHETICWNNPSNRTCKTCKYEEYIVDHTEDNRGQSDSFYVRDCKHKLGLTLLESNYGELGNRDTAHIKPIVNCPHHDLKLKTKLLYLTNEIK